MNMESAQSGLPGLVAYFESLTAESVQDIGRMYAADAFFKDPFNEVRGIDALRAIFQHMYTQVDQPRFIVTTQVGKEDEAFITWDFRFTMKRFSKAEQCIRGATHLRFDSAGLVSYHRDYWDAAEELYEKLPVLGSLMRWLRHSARS